jgi:hypothetical protein
MWERVVVVVPRLAEGGKRQPGDVGGPVAGREPPAAEEVADRVDAEGRVVQEEDAREPGPHKRDKRAPEGSLHQPAELERECQAGQNQRLLGGVDPAHAAVLEKISRVATLVGLA